MKQDLIFLQKKGTFIEVKHFVKQFLLISLWLVKEPTPSKTDMCQEKDKEVYQAPV